jgi:hypothetical protein
MKTRGDKLQVTGCRLQVFRSTAFEFQRSFFKTLTTILSLRVLRGEEFSPQSETTFGSHSKLVFGLALALAMLVGCESNPGNVSTSVGFYYGTGFYDPWYYGGVYYPPDVIVTPPPGGGGPDNGLRPEHPIANPPPDRPTVQPQPVRAAAPAPRPMPSIPSRPRPAGRR